MLKKYLPPCLLLAMLCFLLPSTLYASEDNGIDEQPVEQSGHWDPQVNSGCEPLTDWEIALNKKSDQMLTELGKAYTAYYSDKISLEQLMTIENKLYAEVYPEDTDYLSPESQNMRMESTRMAKERLASMREKASLPGDKNLFAIGDWEDKYLPMPYEYQSTLYNCGPASAVNVVNGYNGYAYYTQSRAAALLGTTTNGTDFGPNWSSVLNKQTMRKIYSRVYGGSYSNWPWVLAEKTISTIRSGRGVILDVDMNPYTTYLPGYPGNSGNYIKHYLAGYGFNSKDPSRRYISYIDPNKFNPAAMGAKTVTFQEMAKATKGMGIIY